MHIENRTIIIKLMISKEELNRLYFNDGMSMQEIADKYSCSINKISYWMNKHDLSRRSKSDAVYLKNNPTGDPFLVRVPRNLSEAKLWGLGLGLYWGEGTKSSKSSIRLGNSDPYLIKQFILFLELICGVERSRLRFGLQLFDDMSVSKMLDFWKSELKINKGQFYKVIVTPSRGSGTYNNKTKFGVMTVYFNNTKLRNELGVLLNQLKID